MLESTELQVLESARFYRNPKPLNVEGFQRSTPEHRAVLRRSGRLAQETMVAVAVRERLTVAFRPWTAFRWPVRTRVFMATGSLARNPEDT